MTDSASRRWLALAVAIVWALAQVAPLRAFAWSDDPLALDELQGVVRDVDRDLARAQEALSSDAVLVGAVVDLRRELSRERGREELVPFLAEARTRIGGWLENESLPPAARTALVDAGKKIDGVLSPVNPSAKSTPRAGGASGSAAAEPSASVKKKHHWGRWVAGVLVVGAVVAVANDKSDKEKGKY